MRIKKKWNEKYWNNVSKQYIEQENDKYMVLYNRWFNCKSVFYVRFYISSSDTQNNACVFVFQM